MEQKKETGGGRREKRQNTILVPPPRVRFTGSSKLHLEWRILARRGSKEGPEVSREHPARRKRKNYITDDTDPFTPTPLALYASSVKVREY